MVVMYKTYELVCKLPAQAVLERIKGLLSKERVRYRADNLSVTSTQIPIVVFGFDPRRFSHANWTGINPFTSDSGLTKVIVRVNRLRAFVWVGFWVACSALAASAMPEPGGAILVIVVTC